VERLERFATNDGVQLRLGGESADEEGNPDGRVRPVLLAAGTNRLTTVEGGKTVLFPYGQWTMDYTYNANGSLTGRRRMDNTGTWRDTLMWSYRGLLDRYSAGGRVEGVRFPGGPSEVFYGGAEREWQYRYNAQGERESRRLVNWNVGGSGVVGGGVVPAPVPPPTVEAGDSLLPWQYYLLGGSKEQRAVWNGRLTDRLLCGWESGRRVYFYPSEYLTYGGSARTLTTRPNGDREYAITDHLGSTRVVLDGSGNTMQTMDYAPFGEALAAGTKPRKSWIDRQQDGESGFRNHGVRQYDEMTGRFISTDALWEKYYSMQTYQYAVNSPIINLDVNGKEVYVNEIGNIRTDIKILNPNSREVFLVTGEGNSRKTRSIGFLGGRIDATEIIENLLAKNLTTMALEMFCPITNLFQFRSRVNNRGEWDYKTRTNTIFGYANLMNGGSYKGTIFDFKSNLHDRYVSLSMTAQDFGNFHYGFMGKALPNPVTTDEFLLKKAGENQVNNKRSRPEWQVVNGDGSLLPPYGDDPNDQRWIIEGFKLNEDW